MNIDTFIDSVKNLLTYLSDLMTFILGIPMLLINWFNSFPTIIARGLIALSILITTILVIKLITMIKELIL